MAHKKHEAMFSWDIFQWKITENALFLCSESAVRYRNECNLYTSFNFMHVFFFPISVLPVQEDAEPGAKPPV